jgi:hypothetical protein
MNVKTLRWLHTGKSYQHHREAIDSQLRNLVAGQATSATPRVGTCFQPTSLRNPCRS